MGRSNHAHDAAATAIEIAIANKVTAKAGRLPTSGVLLSKRPCSNPAIG